LIRRLTRSSRAWAAAIRARASTSTSRPLSRRHPPGGASGG
jgi:hypothetical protein